MASRLIGIQLPETVAGSSPVPSATDGEKILFGLAEELGCVNHHVIPNPKRGDITGMSEKVVVWSFEYGGIWINFHTVIFDGSVMIYDASDGVRLVTFELSNPRLIEDINYYFKNCRQEASARACYIW